MKKLHRLIVTSADLSAVVARHAGAAGEGRREQAARPRPAGAARGGADPRLGADGSGLLSREDGRAERLPAAAARASRPRAPTAGSSGRSSAGEDRYRRGLYTFAKRTAPFAMFGTFDGPSGEACVARREVSNTPLQALTLLNDAVLLEAAQALGEACRRARRATTRRARRRICSAAASTRPPTADEVGAARDVLRGAARRASQRRARRAPHGRPAPGRATSTERAAWTALARAMLNLDEFVTKE